MPLVRIDMPAGRSPEHRVAIGEAVQQALQDSVGVLMEERIQVIAERGPGALVIDPGCLGIARSADAMVVQLMLNRGRDASKKRHFFAVLADALHARTGVRREDVTASLVEVGCEDWPFENGKAEVAESAGQLNPWPIRCRQPLVSSAIDSRARCRCSAGRHPRVGRCRSSTGGDLGGTPTGRPTMEEIQR